MRILFFSFLLLMAALELNATPPEDPICRTPSSLDMVQSIRRAALAQQSWKRQGLSALQVEAPPRLSIERRGSTEAPRVILSGSAGKSYELEALSVLGSGTWRSVLTVNLGSEPFNWDEESAGSAPFQFYRLRSSEPDLLADSAATFRLLDHQGIARDLYYHTHLTAMVVVAAGTDLAQLSPWTNELAAVAKTYTNRIQTWILHSDPAAVRSNVAARAKSLNLNFPILSDSHGLAARSLGLTRAGEVAVVRPPIFTVEYRGAISGAAGSYLGEAVASVNTDQPLRIRRTIAGGPTLNHVDATAPEYSRDIAPIFYRHCAKCHRPGGVAPFAMTNHSVVQEWSGAIKHAVLSGKMPPWHADPVYGHFANDLSLPGESKAALVRWIDAGSPRGEGNDPLAELPSPPAYDEWPNDLGEPDAEISIPLQPIKATGAEAYRYIWAQMSNTSNVWLKAAIIRHSNYRVVHHSLVWPGKTSNTGTADSSTYQFPTIAGYTPGYKPVSMAPDSGIFLARSNWLTFNLHYTPFGTATNDQPVLAVWYHKTRPAKSWNANGIGNTGFVISPRSSDFAVQAEWTVPSLVTLYRMNPHMHLRGKRMKYEVVYPGGLRETLLSVPDYDFNWQIGYDLAEPKQLPAGSRVIVSGASDNSPQNLANPDPSAAVRWGDQSWMEMFVEFIDYTQ